MIIKQELGNSVDNKESISSNSYTREFRDQVIEVYNSGVYATMAECARSYKVPEKLFYQWVAASKNKRYHQNKLLSWLNYAKIISA